MFFVQSLVVSDFKNIINKKTIVLLMAYVVSTHNDKCAKQWLCTFISMYKDKNFFSTDEKKSLSELRRISGNVFLHNFCRVL